MSAPTDAPAIGSTTRVALTDFIVDANIRKDTKLPADFLASVKQHGVLQPVDAYLNPDDGKWHLQDGQLRFLASLDAKKDDIPVLVADPATAEAIRLQRQLILNELRTPITDSDRVTAYQTLFELGVSAEQIAKKTNTPATRVKTALAVSASTVGAEIMATRAIALDHAAVIIDFEDDPETTEALTKTALETPDRFDHQAASFAIAKVQRIAKEKLEQELAHAGYQVIDAPEDPYNGTTRYINYVYRDEKFTKLVARTMSERLPVDTAGLVVWVGESSSWESGRHQYVPEPRFAIEDWEQHGFFGHTRVTSNNSGSGGLSDEDKAKRKAVRDNNKLWQPATVVRRSWIKEFLTRPEMPADALMEIAKYFGRLPTYSNNQSSIFRELLDVSSKQDALAEYLKANPKRTLNILVAGLLSDAEGEYDFGKDGWRNPKAKAHLVRLSAWGYTLSDIEQAVVAGTAEKGVVA
jgi:ParB family transcriptional regulator, chromosome partitioning protein